MNIPEIRFSAHFQYTNFASLAKASFSLLLRFGLCGNLPCRFVLVSVVFSLLFSIMADCFMFVLVCVKIDISRLVMRRGQGWCIAG